MVGQQHWVKQVHTESALKQDNHYGVEGEHGKMQAKLSPDREAEDFLIGLRPCLIELLSDAMASK